MQDTIKNRTIFCKDNLIIMRGINSNSIDLIYLDPPFNTNKVFTAPIGSSAEGASFKDIFQKEDVKEVWLLDLKEDKKRLYDFLIAVKNLGNDYNFSLATQVVAQPQNGSNTTFPLLLLASIILYIKTRGFCVG